MIDWRTLLVELPICVMVCTAVDLLNLPIIPTFAVCIILAGVGVYFLVRKNRGSNRKDNPI